MIVCRGRFNARNRLDTRHEEIAFDGDNPDACPLCEAIRHQDRLKREHEQEIKDIYEDNGLTWMGPNA